MIQFPLYFDYNATTPCDDRVVEEMMPYFTKYFGNAASRNHSYGWQAEEAIKQARERCSNLINCEPNEIIFTSGATESCNLAIKGLFESYSHKGHHIITSSIEHKAVLDSCSHLEKFGCEVTYLPVEKDGIVDINVLEAAIRPTTILISIMYANNEIGTIQNITEIGKIARKHKILFFTDATQAAGKIFIDVNKDEIDLLAFNAHKLYGPKGIGGLFVRRKNPRVKLISQIDGGGHERGLRSGTLNVPGIVGFGKACELCFLEMVKEAERIQKLRDKLEHGLLDITEVQINGNLNNRLPNVTNLSFKNVESESLILKFSKEIAVSTGSACSSSSLEPSYVLKALGVDDTTAYSSVRFSIGRFTTEEEIDYVINKVTDSVVELRGLSPILGKT